MHLKHSHGEDQQHVIQITEEALSFGLVLNNIDIHGCTTLHGVTTLGLTQICQWMATHPLGMIDKPCMDGAGSTTALWWAGHHGDETMIRLLFSMGASFNAKGKIEGWEPYTTVSQILARPQHHWGGGASMEVRRKLIAEIEEYGEGGTVDSSGEVKRLQHLCRDVVRKVLTADGNDIRPKVKDLEIPRALKKTLVAFGSSAEANDAWV